MARIVSKVLVGGLALTGFVFLVAVEINQYDPPLRADVRQILEENPHFSEAQKQAFYFAVGLQSGDTEDPGAKGIEIYEHYLALPSAEKTQYWRETVIGKHYWDQRTTACAGRSEGCTFAYLDQHPEAFAILQEHPDHLLNYARWLSYGDYANIMNGPETSFSPVDSFALSEHKKMILQMIEWVDHGETPRALGLMESSNRFYQSQMASGTILSRVIAAVEMEGNARLLEELLQRKPKLKISHALVESFDVPEAASMAEGGVRTELKLINNFAHDPNYAMLDPAGDPRTLWERTKAKFPWSLFVRRNETLNKYYEFAMEAAKGNQPPVPPGFAWTHASWPQNYLVNPIGKTMVYLVTTNIEGVSAKLIIRVKKLREHQRQFAGRVA